MGKRQTKALPTLSEALRTAIQDCGQTLYRVSKGSGVAYATLHRFMAGKRAVSMEALDKLGVYLQLGLCVKQQAR
jgi:hypothetical protein